MGQSENILYNVNIYVNKGVNMSVTISVRVDEDVKNEIEAMGYKPGEYIRRILIAELKKERGREALSWLREHRLKSKGIPSEELIRADRDSR